ncbi:MAG: TonB-dependent receptor [Chitinophagaceae bacterium]
MLRRLLSTILLFTISYIALAQKGKVSGKVTNNKNEALAGVSIKLSGITGGTTSGIDGTYAITLNAGAKIQITYSYVGYESKTVEVALKVDEDLSLDILMELPQDNGGNVIVKAQARSARVETVNALIQFQKNTNTVAQVISAEAIRRSPDRNTGEVLKRLPGTSVQEGKYLVVRGLADRYNIAMLNGVLLSSTEPDRKTFSFDIFPSTIIDNIIMNKAFVPELPGEWAGGLVQVNTKDIPSSNFFNVQIGTGFNSATIGSDFYKYKGGKTDFLGLDDGARATPDGLPLKSAFNDLNQTQKTEWGKKFSNIWSVDKNNGIALISRNFQVSGGFSAKLGKKNKLGGVFAANYSLSPKRVESENRLYSINGAIADVNFDYFNNKYSNDVLWGAIGNLTLQLGNNHKISVKNLFNVNTSDYTTKRTGKDFENDPINGENIKATELAFKENIFYNVQLLGEHNFPTYKAKLKWYGSFNILSQYIPDQRRIQYNQNLLVPGSPYLLLVSASKTSQRSGSRYYGSLSDYIYTAGGDVTKSLVVNGLSQSLKGGYMLQVKDRLFDSRPFSIYLPTDNAALRQLDESVIFNPENFGTGFNNKFAFNEIFGDQYRYVANTILNAGFIQFDNEITRKLRATWGVRVENFDQLIGSYKKSDPRFVNTRVNDFLPGANIIYKVNPLTNIRLSGSQTVIRPEFRELSPFAFFDFDLGATTTGNSGLKRTKVTNIDLRYELYPRAGELFTFGVFYKYFKNPIELFFNQSGAGSSSTFNYINADKAEGYGVEFEFRKKLDFNEILKNFTFQTNLSYIKNRVTSTGTQLDRPMQGQSPYLINGSLQYDVEKLGLNTTLLFNQIGRRILYVGNNDYPPVWEAPRPLLDLQIAKKILKRKGELKLNISDIINQKAIYYHDLNNDGKYNSKDALAIKRIYGTNVSLSFSYSFK